MQYPLITFSYNIKFLTPQFIRTLILMEYSGDKKKLKIIAGDKIY